MMLAWKILLCKRAHFLVTVAGVTITSMLMMLLLGIYEGVKEGATGYIARNSADLWVSQDNSNNILRSSSHLRASVADEIRNLRGVGSVGTILKVLTVTHLHGQAVTLFLVGVSPASSLTLPSNILAGKPTLGEGELIMDYSFARKQGLSTGDSLQIQGNMFHIVGLCSGTNAIVAQFSFCTLDDAQTLLGFRGIGSFFPVQLQPSADARKIIEAVQARIPGSAVFTKDEFLANTINEMEAGILPILWSIAVLGLAAGALVITLLLYGSVVDRRQDYALLKAIGAGSLSLDLLVLIQALATAGIGAAIGLTLGTGLSPLLSWFIPELTLEFQWQWIATVVTTSLFIASIGAIVPMRKLARIDPEEVFRS